MAGLLWPIQRHRITQGFAGRHPYESAGFLATDPVGPRRARRRAFPNGVPFAHLHGAIDIGCPVGTPILAPEAGTIVVTDRYDETRERYLMLEIRPGTILFFTHLRSFTAREGAAVARGDEIARSGNSGMTTGPHLHWEVRVTRNPKPRFERSGRWFKLNPRRLRVGRDLAGLRAIVPLGLPEEPQDVDPGTAVDLDLPVEDDNLDGTEEDTFGDAALVGQTVLAGDVPPEDLDLDRSEAGEP